MSGSATDTFFFEISTTNVPTPGPIATTTRPPRTPMDRVQIRVAGCRKAGLYVMYTKFAMLRKNGVKFALAGAAGQRCTCMDEHTVALLGSHRGAASSVRAFWQSKALLRAGAVAPQLVLDAA